MEDSNPKQSVQNLLKQPSNTPCGASSMSEKSFDKRSNASISSTKSLYKSSDKSFPTSTFGDFECGGPQKPQHLVFDFTPNDTELDAPEVRKKVADFWKFLWAQEGIEKYCVMPDSSQDFSETDIQTPSLDISTSSTQTSVSDRFSTAINALAEIGVFGEAETFQKSSQNSFGCGYTDTTNEKRNYRPYSRQSLMLIAESSISPEYTISSTYKIGISQEKNAQVRAMCKELEAWDKKHPKSTDPPAHVGHHKAVLQRTLKPYQDMSIKTCECED